DIGLPTRFLYDESMPEIVLDKLIEIFGLQPTDLVMGARYHNFADFIGFPDPKQSTDLHDRAMPALPHPAFKGADTLMPKIWAKDQVVHFPYQKYDYVPQLILEAAQNPEVEAIKITLYRVANRSAITEALLEAVQQGKKVVTFIEVKARFDEASNIYWGKRLKDAGAKVIYSYPAVKVHTKLLYIKLREESGKPDIAYIGTGNFNEKTAKLYCDHALLTAHPTLNAEVAQVFELLEGRILLPHTNDLLIAPYNLRQTFSRLIKQEMQLAKKGQPAYMILKLNSLEDPAMIEKLYEAGQAGVKIQLIIRGICCLIPGVEGLSENISVISIIDRYLEHARIYLFGNGGNPLYYLSSADWMTRNLDHRVEVAVPVFDPDIQAHLRALLDLQLRDNCKARVIETSQRNPLKEKAPDDPAIRSQTDFYDFLKAL
ncbi:MAG: polyphosphate kinase 1, partial [Phaeodactylibacter sp.]|nr:polyphosphate kinase 1 [Phaeodactylibacter sp.]